MTQEAIANQGVAGTSPAWGALQPASDPLTAFRALLLSSAQRAWWGPDATLAAWPCAVTGLNAAPGGSGTTLGALGGVPCPVGDSNGFYRTAAFGSAIAQPYSMVAVARMDGGLGVAARHVHDGIGVSNRCMLRYQTTGLVLMNAGANLESASAPGAGPYVWLTTWNGGSSSLVANGTTLASGSAGGGLPSLTGLTMFTVYNGSGAFSFIGPIALVSIFHGANYAARAATVAAAARALIGV